MGIFANAIESVFASKQYEVTFSVVVHARDIGSAIKRAVLILDEGAGMVKDVKEI